MRYAERVRILAVSVALQWLLLAGTAIAESAPRIQLDITRCPHLSERNVKRILRAELAAEVVARSDADVTSVGIHCEGTAVKMLIRDPVSRKRVQRNIDLLEASPTSRDRLVALAASELVIASWSELEINPTLEVEPAEPPPPPGSREAARTVVRDRMPREAEPRPSTSVRGSALDSRLLALGSVRGFWDYPGALYGGGVRFGREHFGVVSWAVDGLVEQGRVRRPEGSYHISTTTLGGTVAFYSRWRALTARAGAGLRVGTSTCESRVAGATGSASTVAPWGWPLGFVSTSLGLGAGLLLELDVEGGYVVLPISSGTTQMTDGAFRGAWLSAQLGLGFGL